MLDTAFYLVLNMSITASAIGLPLLILRRFKAFPRFAAYAMWSLVFIRLVLPFAFSSEISFFNFTGDLVKKVVAVPAPLPERTDLTVSNFVGAADSYFPVTYKSELLGDIFGAAACVWILVASLGLVACLVLYCITGSRLRRARHIAGNMYQSSLVSSPIVFGIFRQKVIVPPGFAMEEDGMKYVLLHEGVHMKRHDGLWRLAGICAACLHWFNPFVWIYLRIFFEDMELACDTEVIKGLPAEERKEYARTLVNFAAGREMFLSTAFGGSAVKVRVLNVMDYKRNRAVVVLLFVLFLAVTALALLTNPVYGG